MAHFSARHVREQSERLVRMVLRPALYRDREPVRLSAWEAPGEPVSFAEAVRQSYDPVDLGHLWGRPWGTTWFSVQGQMPARFAEQDGTTIELVSDLGFRDLQAGFQCEALVWTMDGRAIKALENYNRHVPLAGVGPGGTVDLYIEAASNPDVVDDWSWNVTYEGSPATMSDARLYTLRDMFIGLRDDVVAALIIDMEVLLGLAAEIGEDTTRGAQIMGALSRAFHAVDHSDVSGSAAAAREVLAPVLAAPAHAGAHRIAAVGQAHIDSAWLWPIRETARKVARTFSNVVQLAQEQPDFVFAASSAQQYAWLKELYPELFERVREAAARGQFVPVGGMWVEADGNLPGGEAMARQFIEGTKFFRENFEYTPAEVWLPDSFGYTGAFPQLARLAGARWFLTQKLSWNEVNKMPHHTFWWEGIDGTRVFTHFPPADTYNSDLRAADLHRAERQYAEKSASNLSLIPYGYGDGGGGPTREMVEIAQRTANLEGSPRVELQHPRDFFARAEELYPEAPVWSGEMYLEFHRGVFTSQSKCKRGNRRSEALLHEAELWAATAAVRAGLEYPYQDLERLWRRVLLYQFHDILPGTSIAWVHEEVVEGYAAIEGELETIIGRSLSALAGEGDLSLVADSAPSSIGEGGFELREDRRESNHDVVVEAFGGGASLESENLCVVVDSSGRITSARDKRAGREVIAPGGAGNKLELFRDHPATWDAWNIDRDYEMSCRLLDAESVTVQGDEVIVTTTTDDSTISQRISLLPGRAALKIVTRVSWHEREKLLKLGFDLDVLASHSSAEVQFGHVRRPVHVNTTWDAARYEVPAHRWLHVDEPGYGIALANSVTYGHDISALGVGEERTGTRIRASLLRAPRYPDPLCDQGDHEFTHVLRLGAGISDAIDEGYRLHLPERRLRGERAVAPLVRCEGHGARVETVKLAEDQSGDVIVRLYEALGGRVPARVVVDGGFSRPVVTDLHEDPMEGPELTDSADGQGVVVALRPFQLVTLRFRRN